MNNRVDKAAKVKAPRPKKNLTLIAIVLLVVVVVTGGLFFTLSTAFKTDTYYILNTDIPAKKPVTTDMLSPVKTSAGTAPANAIGIEQVQRGVVFTKFPLKAKDILTPSNTTGGMSLTTGIPDTWGITSFNITSDNAVGGNIGRGEYFDILGVNPDGSRFLFLNVLALDVSQNAGSGTSVNTPVGTVQTSGGAIAVDMQYIIGMPPEDIAIFHAAEKQFETIKIVKSPYQITYETRNKGALDRIFVLGNAVSVRDLYVGTDATFAEVRRDELGQPVNKSNCAKGYIQPKELCDAIADVPETPELRQSKDAGVSVPPAPTPIPSSSDVDSSNSNSDNSSSGVNNNSNSTSNSTSNTGASSSIAE
jgi:hypothetical protein